MPLTTGVAILVVLVGATRPELASAGAIAPVLASAVPTLWKVLTSFSN